MTRRQFHTPRICKGERAGASCLVAYVGAEVVGVVSVEAVTCGELEAGAHEAAVFGLEKACGERWELVPIRRGSRDESVGAAAWGSGKVVVPRPVGFVFAGDECGLRGRGERRGVGSSSVLEESRTWKTSPVSGVPKEMYSTRLVRTTKEVRKVRSEVVGKV